MALSQPALRVAAVHRGLDDPPESRGTNGQSLSRPFKPRRVSIDWHRADKGSRHSEAVLLSQVG